MKTLEKLKKQKGVITKKNELHRHYESAIASSKFNDDNQTIHYFEWRNKGRTAKDYEYYFRTLFQTLEIEYHIRNDAPKGGKGGNHFYIPNKGDYFVIRHLPDIISLRGEKSETNES